jgi:hypothetical protein
MLKLCRTAHFNIVIFEAFRRQGYGTQALQALEEKARLLLHCPGGNIVIPRGEECGTIISGSPAGMNEQVAACFVQDERQCYPAEFSYIPPDTPLMCLVTSSPSASCKLTMSIGYARLRGNYDGPSSLCLRMVQQRKGLQFQNCGSQGTILVPVTP